MKLYRIPLIMAIALASAVAAPVALAQSPGLVISGSSTTTRLPEKADKFLKKFYPNAKMLKCKQKFTEGIYKVYLSDGTDVEFGLNGQVIEIDAPEGRALPEKVIREILPGKSVKHLEKNGYMGMVESIELQKDGRYSVDLLNAVPDGVVYDVEGVFIGFDD